MAGNVRQLNNIMERLALSFSSGVVSLSAATLLIEDLQADKASSPQQPRHHCPDCQLLEGPYKRIRSRILKGCYYDSKTTKAVQRSNWILTVARSPVGLVIDGKARKQGRYQR
ncbi:Uncharacterised protein [Klebsiella michiganensis]|nr:Uncharacterised protein [Klebsiella michiganensis]